MLNMDEKTRKAYVKSLKRRRRGDLKGTCKLCRVVGFRCKVCPAGDLADGYCTEFQRLRDAGNPEKLNASLVERLEQLAQDPLQL